MEKKYLKDFKENKTKIKLNLKNGKFYTGTIEELGENCLIFLDKFNNKLPFEYDSISYVDVVGGGHE